jgi:hypothetical protein
MNCRTSLAVTDCNKIFCTAETLIKTIDEQLIKQLKYIKLADLVGLGWIENMQKMIINRWFYNVFRRNEKNERLKPLGNFATMRV